MFKTRCQLQYKTNKFLLSFLVKINVDLMICAIVALVLIIYKCNQIARRNVEQHCFMTELQNVHL